MPRRKQVKTLRYMSMQEVAGMFRDVLRSWMAKLSRIALRDITSYDRTANWVTNECKTLNSFLSSKPIEVLRELIPVLENTFVNELSSYANEDEGAKYAGRSRRNTFIDVCINMFRSVSHSCRISHAQATTNFQQKLIIQSFNMPCDLLNLIFDKRYNYSSNNSALLASNIQHLRHLVSFQYNYYCRDVVVKQLSLHCINLKSIDVSKSTFVTDLSIEYLVRLRYLDSLIIHSTSISTEGYGYLISALPNIENISCTSQLCFILDSVTKENLPTIKTVRGIVSDPSRLTRLCPNITSVILHSGNVNLACLSELNGLREIEIKDGNYETANMTVLLHSIGHRLISLIFSNFIQIYMPHILKLCTSLKSLRIDESDLFDTDDYSGVSHDLLHFKSLTSLTLYYTLPDNVYKHFLIYYVNLRDLTCKGVPGVGDSILSDALQIGAFKYIVLFEVSGTEVDTLSIETAWLLLSNCENLEVLGNLGSWTKVTSEDILAIQLRVKTENLDVQILL